MRYTIEQAETGYFDAVLHNPSFGFKTVYTFTTLEGAQQFINKKRAESEAALANIATIYNHINA